MAKTANEVMQEVIFSVVIDAVDALKAASKGLPNTLLREIVWVRITARITSARPEAGLFRRSAILPHAGRRRTALRT